MHNGGGGRVPRTVPAIISGWVFCVVVSQAVLRQRVSVKSSESKL